MAMPIASFPIVYSGSVKKVRAYSSESLMFEFTDQVSVFDWGALPNLISGKGKSLVGMGKYFFEALQSPARWREWLVLSGRISWVYQDKHLCEQVNSIVKNGLKTHYQGSVFEEAREARDGLPAQIAAAALIVEKVKVVSPRWVTRKILSMSGEAQENYPVYDTKRNPGELIPLEVVFRFKLVSGSSVLTRRKDLKIGSEFEWPMVEFFSKLEPQDRYLPYAEAFQISGLTPELWADLILKSQMVASFLQFTFERLDSGNGGIDLIDGKFEWALGSDGQLMLVDSIGPDELRLLKDGRDLSKETLREFYRKTAWYQELKEVKERAAQQGDDEWKKKVKIPVPEIPIDIQNKVSEAYANLFESLSRLPEVAVSEKVILIGSGGREHALAYKILMSPQVSGLVWPTNNLAAVNHLKALYPNKSIEVWPEVAVAELTDAVINRAKGGGVTFAVVGPDAYLAAGVADLFIAAGISCFGPTRAAAQLEWSKSFAKEVMKAAGVHTARSWSLDSKVEVIALLKGLDWSKKWVVKADSLAAGKGVEICNSFEESKVSFDRLSQISTRWIIEEFLEGKEVSIFAFCDGENASVFDPARDYKTLLDGQQGPNTGGMGAISPVPDLSPHVEAEVLAKVFMPMLVEMKKRGTPYCGLLYAGLMVKGDEYWVLEFNARFGDPETQALLPRFKGDFFLWLKASATGELSNLPRHAPFISDASVFVVAASSGYPEAPKLGSAISGADRWQRRGSIQGFFSGVKGEGKNLVTSGGRVLGALGLGKNLIEATAKAYDRVNKIKFEGMHYRTDVGVQSKKVVILASGRGSNFEAIAKAVADQNLNARLVGMVCNRIHAPVFEKAKKYGVESIYAASETDVLKTLKKMNPDFIVLAGYDRIISAKFIDSFRNSKGESTIINIHPSMLPQFKGLHAYALAFDARKKDSSLKTTGVSIHRVEPELDAGPILAQESFSIEHCSAAEQVEALGLKIEHRLYPAVLAKLFQGEL